MILSISQGDHFSEKSQIPGNEINVTDCVQQSAKWPITITSVGENLLPVKTVLIYAVRCIEHVGHHLGSSDCNCRSSVRCFQPVWKMITLDTIF